MTTTPQDDRSALPRLFPRLTLAKEKRPSGKTSTFSVQLAGYLVADALWDAPAASGPMAPVWMAYLSSPAEASAFTANLRAGRLAEVRGRERLRIPKRSGHRFRQQTVSHQGIDAALTVAYLPDFFRLDPPVPIAGDEPVRFVFAPPRWWLAREAETLTGRFGDDAQEAAEAALFVAFLDRRTHLPIVNDLAFHLALYRAAREAEWTAVPREAPIHASRQLPFGTGFTAVGIDTVLVCHAPQAVITDFIRDLTARHREEIRHGTSSLETGCRLLPDPGSAPAQLCLDFAAA